MADFLQRLEPPDHTFHYRKAFTDEEQVEIEKQFDEGEKEEGCFGPEVKAKINGLPVLIMHFKNTHGIEDMKGGPSRFDSLLEYLEQAHQLVTWTSKHSIVKFPHRVGVTGLRPKKEGVCQTLYNAMSLLR